jgi:hypothetical protein
VVIASPDEVRKQCHVDAHARRDVERVPLGGGEHGSCPTDRITEQFMHIAEEAPQRLAGRGEVLVGPQQLQEDLTRHGLVSLQAKGPE